MIERIDEMPEGASGYRFTGEVSKADYESVLIPGLKKDLGEGREVRVLCQLGPGFDGYEAGAMWADMKTGGHYLFGEHPNWHRMAIATDADWVRHMVGLFGWMTPGEVKLFGLEELDAAKEWVAG